MNFMNRQLDKLYKYIYIHDDQTLLLKNIAAEINISRPTLNKYLKWLERRELIQRNGKHFKIIPI